jgi:hypothetical protein
MNNAAVAIASIVGAIIGLAIISVLVGQNAKTSDVITSGGNALSSLITAAVSPVGAVNGQIHS